jgi:GT2 family glycosyltransferase
MRASDDRSTTIAVILTCFNRRQKTVACVDAVLAQSASDDVLLDFFITDDGSHDGTADALVLKCGRIRVLNGNGSLFWNGGMRLAWAEAMRKDYDFFLWLNDDTFLYPYTLGRMLDTHAAAQHAGGQPGIVVGSTHDDSGRTSYGGERQHSWLRPLTLARIEPQPSLQPCDTFNGNCVLISRHAAEVLGNLDPGFVHAMGDTDYGLRARKSGIPMWVMPGYAGRCVNDGSMVGGYGDRTLPLALRWKQMLSPKGLPWRPWRILCQRHAGWLWPFFWSWPYLKTVATSCRFRRRVRSLS